MQCVFLMCMMSVIWAVYGYSLAFGGSGPWIGDLRYLFLRGAEATWEKGGPVLPMCDPKALHPCAHPHALPGYVLHHHAGPDLRGVCRADEVQPMVVFMILWGTLVYCPLAHWVWGEGFWPMAVSTPRVFSPAGPWTSPAARWFTSVPGCPLLRVALRQTSGLWQRAHAAAQPHLYGHRRHHALGGLVWLQRRQRLGRHGFGRQRFAATHLAAAAGGMTWAAIEWIFRGKPTILGTCSGGGGRPGVRHPPPQASLRPDRHC